MWSAATAEISWLLEVLQLQKSSWYAVTFEDFQILKIRRKELLRKNHADKCVDDDKKEACNAFNQRFNNAWDELVRKLPPDWNAGTGNGAEHQTGAGTSSQQQPQADNGAPACSLAPHIDDFEAKHGSLDSRKKMEYMFLYSAQAHCLTCMEFYSSMEGFNVKCISCGKTARQWAATRRNRRGRQAVDIPLDVEAWLQAHDL
jgi:hypothetical protein